MTSDKKEFAKNKVLAEAAEKAKATNERLHFVGLVSKSDVLLSWQLGDYLMHGITPLNSWQSGKL